MPVTNISDPSRIVGENDVDEQLVSKWVAVHNPIIYNMQRKDFDVDEVEVLAGEVTADVTVDVTLPNDLFETLVTGQQIYLNAEPLVGLFTVIYVAAEVIHIEIPPDIYTMGVYNPVGAYVNLVNAPGYYVQAQIGTVTDGTYAVIATAKFQPFSDGLFVIDPAAWLQKVATIVDEFDYIETSWRDLSLANGFEVRFRERYDAEPSIPSYAAPGVFYYVNAAMQDGDLWGQNMGEYVTFNTSPPDYPAKFLTHFSTPTFFPGFPFEIAFIRSQDLDGIDLEYLLTNHDANGTVAGLAVTEDIEAEETGVIRFWPAPDEISAAAYSLKIRILDDTEVEYTEVKTILVSKDCPDLPVYLKWINTVGGWSYWLFAFDQQKSINVGDAVTYEKHIAELSTSTGKLEYLSKRAFPKIVCGANAISAANLAGLKGLLYSPKVMMLTNPDTWETDGEGATVLPKWQTVLVQPGSFNLETTRSGIADVEITLQLSEINIQTQ